MLASAKPNRPELYSELNPIVRAPLRIQINMKSQIRMFTLNPSLHGKSSRKATLKSNKQTSTKASPTRPSEPQAAQGHSHQAFKIASISGIAANRSPTPRQSGREHISQLYILEHSDNTLTFSKDVEPPLGNPASSLATELSHREQTRMTAKHLGDPPRSQRPTTAT